MASRRVLSICLLFCMAAASAHASNSCPWMNEATASGLLGDEAVGSYSPAASPGQVASCTFTQHGSSGMRTLVIEIETTPNVGSKLKAMEKSCSSAASPLQAIGNEAVMCASDDPGNRFGERVVGRVRDQIFAIRISTSLRNDPLLKRDALRSRISSAAEQVAGNLF